VHDDAWTQYVGQFFAWLIETRTWEYMFLAFITFNAAIKFTKLRNTSDVRQKNSSADMQHAVVGLHARAPVADDASYSVQTSADSDAHARHHKR
jgi:hypothetical protein